MKKTLIIVGHPEGIDSSTQQFLYQTSRAYIDVDYLILADEMKDLNQTIDGHHYRQQMVQYDRIIFQFPIYWYQAPAILKLWIDQVFQDWKVEPVWTERMSQIELGVVVTADVDSSRFQAGGDVGRTLSELLSPYEALARYYKMSYLQPFLIHRFAFMSEANKMLLMLAYASYLTTGVVGSLKSYQAFMIEQLQAITAEQLPLHEVDQLTYQMWIDEIHEQASELEQLFTMNGRWY